MKINAREKKLIYAAVIVAVAIFIYHAISAFSPGDGESIVDQIEAQEGLLRRQRDLIGHRNFYEQLIESAENDIEKLHARLLPENNVSAANAELQRILSELANRSGVIISNRSNLQERKIADSDSLVKVSVRIAIDCQIPTTGCAIEEDMVDFLIAVRNYEKLLRVEDISIQSPYTQGKPMSIRRPINITVAGYISVPPPDEQVAKPGENAARVTGASHDRL